MSGDGQTELADLSCHSAPETLPACDGNEFHTSLVHYEDDVPIQIEDRVVDPAGAPGYLDRTSRSSRQMVTSVRCRHWSAASISSRPSAAAARNASDVVIAGTGQCCPARTSGFTQSPRRQLHDIVTATGEYPMREPIDERADFEAVTAVFAHNVHWARQQRIRIGLHANCRKDVEHGPSPWQYRRSTSRWVDRLAGGSRSRGRPRRCLTPGPSTASLR
jgi:hypothetical protein